MTNKTAAVCQSVKKNHVQYTQQQLINPLLFTGPIKGQARCDAAQTFLSSPSFTLSIVQHKQCVTYGSYV